MKRTLLTIAAIAIFLACKAQVGAPKGIDLGSYTTAQMLTITSPKDGRTVWNTDTNTIFSYDAGNGVWKDQGPGSGGGSGTVDVALADGSVNPVQNNAIFDRFVETVDEAANSPDQIELWKGTKAAFYSVYGNPPIGVPNDILFFITDSVAPAPNAGILADGNYGDITISNNGSTLTINNGVVNGDKITDSSINGFTDIQDESITSFELAANSVGNAEMNDGAVGLLEVNTTLYESGSFIPNLVDQGGGATYSFTTIKAEYLKLGGFMYFEVYLSAINTTGSPSGFFRLTGIPHAFDGQPVFAVRTAGASQDFESINAIGVSTQLDFGISSPSTTGNNSEVYNQVSYSNGTLRVSGFAKIQ